MPSSTFGSVVITLATIRGVQAWGALGHATVAYVAQNYLDTETASWAQGVLGDKSDSYLAKIASWADDYRHTDEGDWSAPLHFIDAEDDPPSSCNVDYDRDCGNEGCIVSAIANYTQRVGDARLSDDNISEALKFLVHFGGDIAQPLHDEAILVGGNDINVTFDGYPDNLHADWDTYIPEKIVGGGELTDAKSWAGDLIKDIDSGSYKDQAADWIKGDDVGDAIGTATRWATDSNSFVCTKVMPDGPDAFADIDDLYPDYYNSVTGTIEIQIAKGGYRLANWLNNIYKSNVARRDESQNAAERRDASPDLLGRDLLPAPRPLSRAKLARAAAQGSCCGVARGEHKH